MALVASEWVTTRQRDAAFESLFLSEYAPALRVSTQRVNSPIFNFFIIISFHEFEVPFVLFFLTHPTA